jgi:hypothetical protein
MEARVRALRQMYVRIYGPESMFNGAEFGGNTYKDIGYVKACVEALADELDDVPGPVNLTRERHWWWLVAETKRFLRRDLPAMWREIYLERRPLFLGGGW